MKVLRSVHIRISSGTKSTEYQGQIRVYSPADALKRAALAYLASLVLLVICVFIPIVHFIAVPGLLLLGPVIAFVVYKAFAGQEDLTVKDVKCPNCASPMKLSSTVSNWPLRERCEACNESYLAELDAKK